MGNIRNVRDSVTILAVNTGIHVEFETLMYLGTNLTIGVRTV